MDLPQRVNGCQAGFVKVDYNYTLAVATAARAAGINRFSLVSAANASADSMFLYPATKVCKDTLGA